MSRMAVRNALDAELTNFLGLQVPAVPFYDTVNQRQKPTDPLWVTNQYFVDLVTRDCYGGKNRTEEGTFEVYIFAKAGTGNTAAIQLAEAIEDHFMVFDFGPNLSIQNTFGIDEATQGDARPVYGIILTLEYLYSY